MKQKQKTQACVHVFDFLCMWHLHYDYANQGKSVLPILLPSLSDITFSHGSLRLIQTHKVMYLQCSAVCVNIRQLEQIM